MKKLQEKSEPTTAKETYVKPSMVVYEMEVEGAIMDAASGSDRDYQDWGKADYTPFDNTINPNINA